MLRCPYCKSDLIKTRLNHSSILNGGYEGFKKLNPKKTKIISVYASKSPYLGTILLCSKCVFCTTQTQKDIKKRVKI